MAQSYELPVELVISSPTLLEPAANAEMAGTLQLLQGVADNFAANWVALQAKEPEIGPDPAEIERRNLLFAALTYASEAYPGRGYRSSDAQSCYLNARNLAESAQYRLSNSASIEGVWRRRARGLYASIQDHSAERHTSASPTNMEIVKSLATMDGRFTHDLSQSIP